MEPEKDLAEEIVKVFRQRVYAEVETLICCKDGVAEEHRILGRIEAMAEMVRFIEGRMS